MAPFKPFRKQGAGLTAQLAAKASTLTNQQARESAAAATYAELSAASAQKSATAASHSEAVARAIGVLEEAGVQ